MIGILKKLFDKKTTLPPVKVEKVLGSLSEIEDWGLVEHKIPEVGKKQEGKVLLSLLLTPACQDTMILVITRS